MFVYFFGNTYHRGRYSRDSRRNKSNLLWGKSNLLNKDPCGMCILPLLYLVFTRG